MERKNIRMVIIVLGIFLIILIGFFIFSLRGALTGQIIGDYYTFTKAVCEKNETGWFCQDYTITCENNQLKSMNPITGANVQNPDDWIDPRNQTQKDKLCE